MRYFVFFFFISLFQLLAGCSGEEENRLDVDVSAVDVSLDVFRLEEQLFQADTAQMRFIHRKLVRELGTFYDYYLLDVLRAGSAHDPMVPDNVKLFVSDTAMKKVYSSVKDRFGDFGEQEKLIENSFKHLKYYYPDAHIPRVVTFVAPFMYRCVPTDSVIGIGLEMYLGPSNPVVKQISVQYMPEYIKEGMKIEFLPVDVIRAWLEEHYAPPRGEDFLSAILFEGKILYAVDAMMPELKDHIKIRYTKDQLLWCVKNEGNIWHEVVDQEWLYSKDKMLINKMIGEAPFTAVLPRESPPRAGAWLGWMIVRDFMEANPELDVVDLLAMPIDKNQKILNAYNPG